jgi:hypothetical protein
MTIWPFLCLIFNIRTFSFVPSPIIYGVHPRSWYIFGYKDFIILELFNIKKNLEKEKKSVLYGHHNSLFFSFYLSITFFNITKLFDQDRHTCNCCFLLANLSLRLRHSFLVFFFTKLRFIFKSIRGVKRLLIAPHLTGK